LKENKTKKIVGTAIVAALSLTAAGCSDASLPPQPEDQECNEWDWDDELGVWECDEYDSNRFGYYYYGGMYYASKAGLIKSKPYKSYKGSSSFKGGFGSGSKGGFGG
jgi:hypothetical protein